MKATKRIFSIRRSAWKPLLRRLAANIKSFRISWKTLLLLTLAGCVNAFGVTMFLVPVHLYDSGFSGTSMLLGQLTPEYMTLSLFLVLLNVPVFLYGLRKQGTRFTIDSIYTVLIYSAAAWLITDVLPIDVSAASPLAGQDLLLCAIFGGAISGLGSGLAIRFGGAMDGIEVLSVIFAKRIGITVGTFVMIYNVILYVICGILMRSWVLPLYSIITYMAGLKMVDFVVDGLDREKCAMIVTEKPDAISASLIRQFERGTTLVSAAGGYSGVQKTIVYFVVNRFQITRMKQMVYQLDPSAFVTLHEISDVFRANDRK